MEPTVLKVKCHLLRWAAGAYDEVKNSGCKSRKDDARLYTRMDSSWMLRIICSRCFGDFQVVRIVLGFAVGPAMASEYQQQKG